MYAILEAGGHQFRAERGKVLSVPKLDAEVGATIQLGPVLLFAEGDDVRVGRPSVDGVRVSAEVLSHGKDRKITIFKMRRRKTYRKTIGHRQQHTKVRITEIAAG